MDEQEDRLQAGLESLELGKSLADVQQSMPEDESALLALAERLRSIEWSEQDPKQVEAQRKQVLIAYHNKEMEMNSQKYQPPAWLKGWRLPALLSAGAMTLVFVIAVAIGLSSLVRTVRQAVFSGNTRYSQVDIKNIDAKLASTKKISPQQALLVNLHGLVEIQNGETWQAAQPGDTLEVSAHVRTGELSSAALLFKDGSSAFLSPNSELAIDTLNANPGRAGRDIVLVQVAGESDHDVAKVKAEGSRYLVQTASGSAAAHGTEFHVRVTEAQTFLFVSEGTVEMSGLTSSVMVIAGQMTTVALEAEPEPPMNFFTGTGEVAYIGSSWVIAGQTLATQTSTLVMGAPQVGDIVFFEGHLLADQTSVVDLIVLVRHTPDNTFSLTGTVGAIQDSTWTVNNQAIAVTEATETDEGIVVGDLVQVEGTVQPDGTLQATTIRRMEDQPGLPFDFTGVVQQIGDTQWVVLDVQIAVNAETVIESGLAAGDLVRVQGWILEDGTWQASSIQRELDETSSFEFQGKIQNMSPWVVAGIAFETRDWTAIDDGLRTGDLVHVEGQIMEDGTWVAFEVTRYDQPLTTVLIGRVFSMAPWVVGGMTLNVDAETEIDSSITIGMLVRVEMTLMPDGTFHVVRIDPVDGYAWEEGCQTIVVTVVGVAGGELQLEGWPALQVSDDLTSAGGDGEKDGEDHEGDDDDHEGDDNENELDSLVLDNVTAGSIVQITICFNKDGTFQVTTIIVLYQPEETPVAETGEKVLICHKPNGKNPHEITVAQPAVPAHLGHGDKLGPCP